MGRKRSASPVRSLISYAETPSYLWPTLFVINGPRCLCVWTYLHDNMPISLPISFMEGYHSETYPRHTNRAVDWVPKERAKERSKEIAFLELTEIHT